MTGRILREPTFQHTFFLFKHLQDAPEAGKGGGAKYGGKHFMTYEYRSGGEGQSRDQ